MMSRRSRNTRPCSPCSVALHPSSSNHAHTTARAPGRRQNRHMKARRTPQHAPRACMGRRTGSDNVRCDTSHSNTGLFWCVTRQHRLSGTHFADMTAAMQTEGELAAVEPRACSRRPGWCRQAVTPSQLRHFRLMSGDVVDSTGEVGLMAAGPNRPGMHPGHKHRTENQQSTTHESTGTHGGLRSGPGDGTERKWHVWQRVAVVAAARMWSV